MEAIHVFEHLVELDADLDHLLDVVAKVLGCGFLIHAR